jgi:hypothetical protein
MIAAEFYAIGNEAIKKSHEPSPLMPIYGPLQIYSLTHGKRILALGERLCHTIILLLLQIIALDA